MVCRNQIAVFLQEYIGVLPAIYRYMSSDDVETPNLHVSKNLNISKTKQDIEELKMPFRLVWKCCSVAFKKWHFKNGGFSKVIGMIKVILVTIYKNNSLQTIILKSCREILESVRQTQGFSFLHLQTSFFC